MERNRTILYTVVLTVVGSFIAFYATNLLLSDVSNMFYMTITKDVISTMPIFCVMLEFILATIATIRLYRYPQYRRSEALVYNVILIIFALGGIVTGILTGTMIYHSFTVPYPFPCASILAIIWHVCMLVLAIVQLKKSRKWERGSGWRRQSLLHILNTLFLCVMVFCAFNRFGALLWMPVYVQVRTLSITFWFYISLLLPIAILFHTCIHMFGFDVNHPNFGIWFAAGILIADVILGAIVYFHCMKNTLYISAVSPALAIERLLTKPIDTILQYTLVFVLGLYSLWVSIRHRKPKKASK